MLICGLGNFGNQYNDTRHNVGFHVLDLIANKYQVNFLKKDKFKAQVVAMQIANIEVMLIKPLTYMNLSGQAVQAIANYHQIKSENIIVIHDDIELALGKIKAKIGGGNAGHNGLKSLDQAMGKNYIRVRVGVDRPNHDDVAAYVLGKFTQAEKSIIEFKYHAIIDALPLLVNQEIAKFNDIFAVNK